VYVGVYNSHDNYVYMLVVTTSVLTAKHHPLISNELVLLQNYLITKEISNNEAFY